MIWSAGKKIAKARVMANKLNKTLIAKKLGIARSTLYYRSKKDEQDKKDKAIIELVMGSNPSYGHKRIAIELGINKKKILRIMHKFSLRPKIVRGKKWLKKGDLKLPAAIYQNEVKNICPIIPNVAWSGDFTYIKYRGVFIYLATVIDICTREIIGASLGRWHNKHLIKSALIEAIKNRGALPKYFHSDQGSEYQSGEHAEYLEEQGVKVSMSKKSSPWENGYQESFYSNFKLELGPVNRFATDGHLAEAIYHQIYYYNNRRIHTELKMPPTKFYELNRQRLNM